MARDIKINIGARDNASRVLQRTSGAVKRLGTASRLAMKGLAIGAAAGAAAFVATGVAARKMLSDFAKAGDQLNKMSLRTGIAVEALSELKFAAEQSGSSLEGIENGVRGMQRALLAAELGATDTIDALELIGVELKDLKGKLPEDQFTLLVDALANVEDKSKRAGLAMRVFGRSGTELLPLMSEGAKGVAELREELIKLGGQMTAEQAQAAADYTDSINRLKTAFTGLRNELGSEVAPALTGFIDNVTFGIRNVNILRAGILDINIAFVQLLQTLESLPAPLRLVGAEEGLKLTLADLRRQRAEAMEAAVANLVKDVTPKAVEAGEAMGEGFARVARGYLTDERKRFLREMEEFGTDVPDRPGFGLPLAGERPASQLQATQGRLLTRGRGSDPMLQEAKKQSKFAEDLTISIDELYEEVKSGIDVKIKDLDPDGFFFARVK